MLLHAFLAGFFFARTEGRLLCFFGKLKKEPLPSCAFCLSLLIPSKFSAIIDSGMLFDDFQRGKYKR